MTTKHAPCLKYLQTVSLSSSTTTSSINRCIFIEFTLSHFYASPAAPSDSSQQIESVGVEFLFILALCMQESFVSRVREFIVEMVALLTFVTHLALAYVWVDKFATVSLNIFL